MWSYESVLISNVSSTLFPCILLRRSFVGHCVGNNCALLLYDTGEEAQHDVEDHHHWSNIPKGLWLVVAVVFSVILSAWN